MYFAQRGRSRSRGNVFFCEPQPFLKDSPLKGEKYVRYNDERGGAGVGEEEKKKKNVAVSRNSE